MEWYPFELGDHESLSADIAVGDPERGAPEVEISRFDGNGELIATVLGNEFESELLFAEAPAAADLGPVDLGPLDALLGGDSTWVGFDHAIPAADLIDALMAEDVLEASAVFADSVVIGESSDDAGTVERVVVSDSTETLDLSDVLAGGDLSGAVSVFAPSASDGDVMARFIGSGEIVPGVSVVLESAGSDDIYFIDFII